MKMSQNSSRLILFFLLALWSGIGQSAVGRDPYTYFFNETWNNFAEELQKARAEGKKGILLFFEMDECPFCHRMKTTVLNQPEVQKYFRDNFLNFSVDIEGDVEMTDFKGQTMLQKDFAFKVNRVRATPVFAFYDLQGNQVVRYTGATSSIKEFMWLGEYAAQGIYKQMRFTKYKREKAKAAQKVK
jgi:thioredoxin-related protein